MAPLMPYLKCPLCGEACIKEGDIATCPTGHFSLDGSGYPLCAMLNNLAYCWEDVPLEEILEGTQTKVLSDHLTYIRQWKRNWKIEAEGRLHNIIGLFGAFKRLT